MMILVVYIITTTEYISIFCWQATIPLAKVSFLRYELKHFIKVILLVSLFVSVPPALLFMILITIGEIIAPETILETIHFPLSFNQVTIIGSACIVISLVTWFLWSKISGKDP